MPDIMIEQSNLADIARVGIILTCQFLINICIHMYHIVWKVKDARFLRMKTSVIVSRPVQQSGISQTLARTFHLYALLSLHL